MKNDNHHKGLLERMLPFVDWLKLYKPGYLRYDLTAGLTVAVVLIPQAMAYAMLAGLPAVYGLYAAAITPFIAALWGSLRQLATGPIAIMSLLVLTSLVPLAEPGSAQYIELAFLLSAMVGVIYLLIGLSRMGFIMAFISHAAVKGFTSAAALIITSTQLPHLLGVKIAEHEYLFEGIWELILAAPSSNLPTLLIGLAAMAIIYWIRRFSRQIPGGLIAILATSLVVYFLGLDREGVAVVGHVPGGLPGFHLPVFGLDIASDLMGPAIVMALVSFAETYSVGKEIAGQTRQKIDVDQEFIGQGLANLAGSFFQCYPVNGSFARTAINFNTGAKTGISSVISSLSVVLALLFLTPYLTYIPRSAMAGLVITAVLTLFHPGQVLRLWRMNRHDGTVAITVFSLSLLTKPDYALLIGVVMSLIFFLWKTMHPRIVRLTRDPDLNLFLNADLFNKPSCPQILHLRVDNVIYFANAEYTMEHVLELMQQDSDAIKVLLLDMQAVGFVDLTAIDEIGALREELNANGFQLAFCDMHLPVRQAFERSNLTKEAEANIILENQDQAISHLVRFIDHGYCKATCPHALFRECPNLKGWTRVPPAKL